MVRCDGVYRSDCGTGAGNFTEEARMSLDVYLYDNYCTRCERGDEVYRAAITHNLIPMAVAAGIYDAVWRPDGINIKSAEQLIEPLKTTLAIMEVDQERFEVYNSPNGWGTYKNFVSWLKRYLAACEDNPGAHVVVSR